MRGNGCAPLSQSSDTFSLLGICLEDELCGDWGYIYKGLSPCLLPHIGAKGRSRGWKGVKDKYFTYTIQMRQIKMPGHPSYTPLGRRPTKASKPPQPFMLPLSSRTGTLKAHKTSPCFKNKAHQQLKRYRSEGVWSGFSQSQEVRLCSVESPESKMGASSTPQECLWVTPGQQGPRPSGQNIQPLDRAVKHRPYWSLLHINHPR